MASTSKGQAIAAPQIFSSDPVEQTFARGVLDPTMGGIAYAYLTAARAGRDADQQRYLDQLTQSNKMASQLAQQEIASELSKTAISHLADVINAGQDTSVLPTFAQLYDKGMTPDQVNVAAALARRAKEAKIAHDMASAAAAGAGSRDKFEIRQDWDTGGGSGGVTTIYKGSDPNRGREMINEYGVKSRSDYQPGGPRYRPNGTDLRGGMHRMLEQSGSRYRGPGE